MSEETSLEKSSQVRETRSGLILPEQMHKKFDMIASGDLVYEGVSSGFHSLDECIKLAKGYLLVMTGYPGTGKSEILDAILTNLGIMHGWKTLMFSPENFPIDLHMTKMAERYIGKKTTQMTRVELELAKEFLRKTFSWMFPEDPDLSTLLEIASWQKAKHGLDVLVLDPWNNIQHKRSGDLVHEYLANALSRVIRFARTNEVLTIICAHPKSVMKNKDGSLPSLTLSDISDGPMWWNKADYGVVVGRPDRSKHMIEVKVQKIKQKWMGHPDIVNLDYQYSTGRFKDQDAVDFMMPHEEEPPPF